MKPPGPTSQEKLKFLRPYLELRGSDPSIFGTVLNQDERRYTVCDWIVFQANPAQHYQLLVELELDKLAERDRYQLCQRTVPNLGALNRQFVLANPRSHDR